MRTRSMSIGGLMWIILAFAVGLALSRGGPEVRWLARYWFLLILGGMILNGFWFLLVPKASLKLAWGSRDRQRRILRCVVGTPAPGGLKLLARYLLGINEQVSRRYEAAEMTYRAILEDTGMELDPGFESTIRQHLADTIEALGRREEAAAERKRAAAPLGAGRETTLSLQSRGKLLDRQHRYDEAVAAYERSSSSPLLVSRRSGPRS